MKTINMFLILFSGFIATSICNAQVTVEIYDPGLETLIDLDAKLEMVVNLGEGASVEGGVWKKDPTYPDGGYFMFSNRGPREIAKWSVNTPLSTAYDLNKLLPNMEEGTSASSGTGLDPQGRLVICSGATHSIIRIENDGSTTVLAHLTDKGLPLHRPNDITIARNGTIYFTDNSRDTTGQVPPVVYMIKNSKMIEVVSGEEITGPNGLTLSPDDKVLYVNNSPTRKVYAYDVKADGTVSNGRLFYDLGGRDEPGTTDGIRTDIHGNVYDTGPGGLWIFSPEGKALGRINTPERLTNLAFGGPDGKTLLLTGHEMVFYIQLKVQGI